MNKSDYANLTQQLITAIGGEENVISLFHCVTRLRFNLKNFAVASANKEKIEAIPGVLSVVEANNQFQVVIGNEVENVYNYLISNYKIHGLMENDATIITENDTNKGNYLVRFFNVISSIFQPIIIALAGSGMLKAVLVILTTYKLMNADSATYHVLSAAGNACFYFLPLLLAISSARVFRANQFVALCIVGALLEPNFTGLITQNGVKVEIFGIPSMLMGYSGTVLPAILAIFVYAHFEKILKKFIPKSIEIFALPLIAILVMVPITVMIIGPTGVVLSQSIGSFINFISAKSGLLAGLIIGAGWTYLVMVGIHWGVVPIMINNIATQGFDTIRPMIAAATFASAGVALGVFLKAKDKEIRSLALSSLLPALLGGITEPIVYGLSIKYKKPLIAQTIAGGIAGAFMGALGVKAIVYVFPALTTLPAFFGPTFVYYIVGIILAFILSALLTYFIGLEVQKEAADNLTWAQPVIGQIIPLSSVNDKVFASGAMGEGVAIIPKDGTLYAPFDGTVQAIFPTKHALGLVMNDGSEVLIHIGINTVELKGQYFDLKVQSGDKIKKGQLLGTFDVDHIKQAGFDPTTMVIITSKGKNIQNIDNLAENILLQLQTSK